MKTIFCDFYFTEEEKEKRFRIFIKKKKNDRFVHVKGISIVKE
jgi:hypothetical protein